MKKNLLKCLNKKRMQFCILFLKLNRKIIEKIVLFFSPSNGRYENSSYLDYETENPFSLKGGDPAAPSDTATLL